MNETGVGFSRKVQCESHGQKGAKVGNREVVPNTPLLNGARESFCAVYYKYFSPIGLRTAGAPAAYAAKGSSIVNVEPLLVPSLSALIAPACMSARFLAIASPNPRPP